MKWGQAVAALGACVMPALAQYAGPAILSRGEAPSGMNVPEIDFRPYVGAFATYSSGLANVSVNNEGGLANESSYGASLAWGVSGTHSWKHTKLGLAYSGTVAHYVEKTAFDSISQTFLMGLTHQLKRHVSLNWRNSMGLFSRDHGERGLVDTVPFDPATTYTPTTDFFDNRTIYLSTQLDMVYQKSARWSFDFGGAGFIVRRRSSALYGMLGGSASADTQYRVSKRTTVGAEYDYTHYDFTKIFGGSDLHGVALTYSVALSRVTEFSGYAGAYRVESKFVQQVPIDPTIAALLGIFTAEQVVHSINYMPNVGVRISRTFSKGVAYASAGRTVTPGNGLFLTSSASTVMAGYGYNGIRRWTISAGVDRQWANSLGNIRGGYASTSGSATAARSLGRMLHLAFDYSARQYDSASFGKYNRLVQSAGVGIVFAPGDVPLHIW